MADFSQDFLDSLAPRDQVFEIKEHSDFAIRVFPNGSKTWVFIYRAGQGVQRRTLGIYPQMGIEQAHDALREARRSTGAKRSRKGAKNIRRTRRRAKPPVKKGPSGFTNSLPIAMIVTGILGIGVFLTLHTGKDFFLASEDARKTSGFVKANPPAAVAYSTDKVAVTEAAPLIDLPDDDGAKEEVAAPEIPTLALKPQSASENAGILAPPTPAPEASAVKRAQFTNGIENREPIDRISRTLAPWDYKEGAKPIFFFTEVSGLEGRTIYHRWELNGRVVSEIPFDVKSSLRWRVFSSKNIMPTMAGRWRVSVVDDLDNVLYSQGITLSTRHLMSVANAPKGPARMPKGK